MFKIGTYKLYKENLTHLIIFFGGQECLLQPRDLLRSILGVEMLGNLPFPHKFAILNFSDSVCVSFAIRGFL